MPSPGRLWRTLAPLPLGVVLRRVARPWRGAWARARLRAERREEPVFRPPGELDDLPSAPREWLGEGRFRFLTREVDLGTPVDWHGGPSRLWRYHLHYLDPLRDPGRPRHERLALLDSWIAGNPTGTAPGWDPYPVSLRLVNALGLLGPDEPADGPRARSLALQAEWLEAGLERDLGANHLWKNAVALAWAGRLFRGRKADRWRRIGDEEIVRALGDQLLADGFHFERSPGYHALMVEDLLRLDGLLRRLAPDPIAEAVRAGASRACSALASVLHPDGEIPLFNDAAFGQATPAAELLRRASDRGIAWRADPAGAPAAGFHRLESGDVVLILDAGEVSCPEQPGHAHADTLSYELSFLGRRVVVDAGVFDYDATPERRYVRSTAAHNTVEVDGRDSSEMWSVFRVGRRARPRDVRRGADRSAVWIEAAHDGYAHLSGAPIHRRRATVGGNVVEVDDVVEGRGRHRAASRLRLHPDFRVVERSDRQVVVRSGDLRARVVATQGAFATVAAPYFPRFGERFESTGLTISGDGPLPLRLSYRIELSRSDASSDS